MIRTLPASLLLLALVGCTSGDAPSTPTPAPGGAPAAPAPAAEPAAPAAAATAPAAAAPAAPAAGEAIKVDPAETTPADQAPGTTVIYGKAFAIADAPVPLATAIAAGATETPVKVSATVEKVCRKKGCWFTLTGEGITLPVRVAMYDYSFFVPRNVTSADVVVEGTLNRRVMPVSEAQHYAYDEAAGGSGAPAKVEAPVETWEFIATSVQVSTT